MLALAAWALVNGVVTLTPSGVAEFPTLASLPFFSLIFGAAGSVATVFTAVLLVRTVLAKPLRYAGAQALTIYLALVIPMAATRILLLKSGLIQDVGLVSLIVTSAALIGPLIAERLVRNTPASFLFRRPAAFRIERPKSLAVQTA
jgi:fumarate reductase subunit D